MTDYSEEDIVEGISHNKHDVLEYVYKNYFPAIRWKLALRARFLQEDDVWDIFQDALVVLYRKLTVEKIELKCTAKTFIYAVCKLMIKQRRDKLGLIEYEFKVVLDEIVDPVTESEVTEFFADLETLNDDILEGLIIKYYRKLQGSCKKILRMFYKGSSLKEIAEAMKLKNEIIAKKQKYRCLNYLKNLLKDDSTFQQVEKNLKQYGKRY